MEETLTAATSPDDAAWAEVAARWQEDEAHLAFLARCDGLEALAEAGRRYKAALDARPADPVALRWRDEVVRRATAIAMAQLPRTAPPRQLGPGLRRALLLAAILGAVLAVAWILLRFRRLGAF